MIRGIRQSEGVEITTARLLVRTPRRGDGAAYARYYSENRDFLQPWSPSFRPEMFSEREWEESIPVIHHQFSQGVSIRFGLFEAGTLIGVANFTDIKGSPMHSAVLGYTLSESRQGHGLMYEALQAAMEHVYQARHLHRITANYMPRNERSGKLLRKLGFFVEGFARDYLLINGAWEDHVLAAHFNRNWER